MQPEHPTDPDVDLRIARQRTEIRRPWGILGAIAAGGALGSLARYGISVWFPAGPAGFPWAVFSVNVAGCLLIGVLMTLVTEVSPMQRLIRPFFGVGVLGGFTTFSTYAVDSHRLLDANAPGAALAYLAGTPVAALVAVAVGDIVTRALVGKRS